MSNNYKPPHDEVNSDSGYTHDYVSNSERTVSLFEHGAPNEQTENNNTQNHSNGFCVNCGNELSGSDLFCGKCGTQSQHQPMKQGQNQPQYPPQPQQTQQPPQLPQQYHPQYPQPQQPDVQQYPPQYHSQPMQMNQVPYYQPQQATPAPKKKIKPLIIAAIVGGAVVVVASLILVFSFLMRNDNPIEAFNYLLDEIRLLEDFSVYNTNNSVNRETGDEFRIVTRVYASVTLNEYRRISTFYNEEESPFVMHNAYIDGIEYQVTTPFFSMPEVMIYEQFSTRRMEDRVINIDEYIENHTNIPESMLERFLTRDGNVFIISITGNDVLEFLIEDNEENDGANEILLHLLSDVDMTEAYYFASFERDGDGFRIIYNTHFPELHSSESVVYISPWDPEPIVPFFRDDFDMSLIDDAYESFLRDEYFDNLDLPSIDDSMERWRVQGDWSDFTGFDFKSEFLTADLELLSLMNHPPWVDLASWYMRHDEINVIRFPELGIDVSNIDSINIEYRTVSNIQYADEAVLEMMEEIDDDLYIDLNGFYLIGASEQRDFSKVVVLRWSVEDDEPIVFLFAAQENFRETGMFTLSIELYLNRLVESDVELLRELQELIWTNMLRDIYQQMEFSALNLEEQLANMP